ncbi:MAG: DUF99 family protein [Candidatus Methanodesulfokora sp.]|jgi:endonuclease V-like protein UPF0215 family
MAIRVLAVDDAPFRKGVDKLTFIVCLLFRDLILEKAIKTKIEVDGSDAEERIVEVVDSLKGEVNILMLHGTTMGGFNMIDLSSLHKKIGIPIVSFLDRAPRDELVVHALRSAGKENKIEDFLRQPKYTPFRTRYGVIYCLFEGIDEREVENIVERYCIESKFPEQLRIANIVASIARC